MNYFRNTEDFHIDFMVGRCLESCLLSAYFWQSQCVCEEKALLLRLSLVAET